VSRHVDLDELAAAARAEAKGEHPTITFKDETFVLPVEMPLEVVEAWMDDADAVTFAKALFGDDYERFKSLHPSQQDVFRLAGQLKALFGVSQGESKASGVSSGSTGESSRPTSNARTRSTSAKRAGGRKQSGRVASAS
jgi:hypothetical protein